MKSIIKKILLLFLVVSVIFSTKILAAEEFKAIEKSEEFKKWENLSEEERRNSIQPQYQTLTFKDGIKRSVYNNLLNLRESTLSNYYSLKDDISIKVKDQKTTSSCWAFSFTSVLETTYQKKLSVNREYSPYHIELKTAKMFNRDIDDGGNPLLALAYSTSGNGPVLEENMPISSVYNDDENDYVSGVENLDLNKPVTGKLTASKQLPSIFKTYSDGNITYTDGGETTYNTEQVNAIRNLVKQFIKQYGAVSACLYSDIGLGRDGEYISEYYNPETYAYYCNDSTKTPNHAVTIVGWDDDFATTDFKEGKQPTNKGAYIILNSYGTEFGENGYMYVSYDDCAIENLLVGIESLENETDYDKIYQYDELGANYDIFTGATDLYSANIFTRDTSKQDMDEYLNEVGVYLLETEGIEVYLSRNGDLTNPEQVAAPGVLEAGYHTVKLSSPQKLENEKFAVVIKYTNAEGASIPLEANLYDSGATFISNNIYSTAKANEGESKFSLDGTTWNEINNTKVGYTVTLKNTNNCIKAFTAYQEKPTTVPVTGVEITEENITINKGNTANIVATVKPETATNKNVSWSTSDDDIATVENGVVTGISGGTATVTVITEDGNKTDSCTVTVVDNGSSEVIPVTGVEINIDPNKLVVKKGTTYTVTATVTPENATNKNITWSSSNENVIKIVNGVITAIGEGTSTITVTTEDGNKVASITVKVVSNEVVPVENVSLNKETLKLEVGDETNLVVSFNPRSASNKNVKWTSSNEKVASISDTGIIKALSEGKTTITVTTEDGNKTATCELTVVKKTNSDDDIYKSDGSDNTTNKKDNTIAKVELPNTGLRIILIILVAGVVLIGVISFIKYKEYSEIK